MNEIVFDIAERAVELIGSGTPFAVAAVITETGSTPRNAGAMMLIESDNSIVGTVGGGLLEAAVQQRAHQVIEEGIPFRLYHNLDTLEAGAEGMICGGETEIFIDYIDVNQPIYRDIYRGIVESFQNNRMAWLGFHVPDENGREWIACRQCLLLQEGDAIGAFPVSEDEIQVGKTHFDGYDVFTVSEQAKMFLMCVGSEAKAVLFGAGHVSEKLAPVLSMVGFRVAVVDDRSEFASVQRFPMAEEVLVVDTFTRDLFKKIECDANTYLVIVTRGHAFDRDVLEQALGTPARYIGMIGSRTKRDAIYEALLTGGFTAADIARVHAPIGVPIHSETPEEIAVSIAAEMIDVRRSR